MLNKIGHKTNRYGFFVKIQTNDTILDLDLTTYENKNYVVPENTVNELVEIAVDAISFNSNDNKKFVNKIFEYFNKDQMDEALLYLCGELNVKIVEE